MTTQKKLENKGYKVIHCMSGKVIARKGSREYIADNITQLFKKIFQPL